MNILKVFSIIFRLKRPKLHTDGKRDYWMLRGKLHCEGSPPCAGCPAATRTAPRNGIATDSATARMALPSCAPAAKSSGFLKAGCTVTAAPPSNGRTAPKSGISTASGTARMGRP
ncbi:hypothetical protein AKL17_2p0009 (plasmid) [Frigidibacter mobilis]|uniref:Uncharacterized protein n=1 Tax=Frigidibacter mobilis TaxID=1335048 RepID=A0A159Z9A3_9RHOB|nr:hypothetical protein AKL17_2p0009 [Frigidibacter mobilis]